MIDLFILILLSLILVNLLNNIFYFSKHRRLRNSKKNFYPFISILIPCRDEERNIKKCINSILIQDYPNFEIIAVDDASQDRTYSILKNFEKKFPDKIKVIKGKPLPNGWTGKNWACHQLSMLAKGEWLVFMDADTRFITPNVLSWVVNIAEKEKASLVSSIPSLETITLSERIILPVIHFAFYLLFPFRLMNKISDPRVSAAIGTFLMIKRKIYDKINGHSGIKNEIVDDMEMAKRVKKAGGKIVMLEGVVKVRFYRNLKEIWNGFSKNSFGAFEYSVSFCLICLAFSYVIFLHPFVMFIFNPSISLNNPAFVEVIFIIFMRLLVVYKTGQGMLSVILHPLMIGFSLLFTFNSLYLSTFKKVVIWKERTYKI